MILEATAATFVLLVSGVALRWLARLGWQGLKRLESRIGASEAAQPEKRNPPRGGSGVKNNPNRKPPKCPGPTKPRRTGNALAVSPAEVVSREDEHRRIAEEVEKAYSEVQKAEAALEERFVPHIASGSVTAAHIASDAITDKPCSRAAPWNSPDWADSRW